MMICGDEVESVLISNKYVLCFKYNILANTFTTNSMNILY